MSFTSSYVMAGIGTFFILFWLFLYIKYRNAYDQVIDAIDKKKFMFGEIYFIGFGFITLFHINIKTERGSKKIKEISEIYGRKYAEFYHYVITGVSISYFLTLLPMGFCLGAIANNVMLGVLGVVASALLLEYMSGEIKKNVNERREDILEDLPQMLSKFTLRQRLFFLSCFSVCSFLFISECIFCKVCLSTRRPRKLLLSSARVWL